MSLQLKLLVFNSTYRGFRIWIVWVAFLIKISGYPTVLSKKRSYGHIGCIVSFSKKKSLKPFFPFFKEYPPLLFGWWLTAGVNASLLLCPSVILTRKETFHLLSCALRPSQSTNWYNVIETRLFQKFWMNRVSLHRYFLLNLCIHSKYTWLKAPKYKIGDFLSTTFAVDVKLFYTNWCCRQET